MDQRKAQRRFLRIWEQASESDREEGRAWYPIAWDESVKLARGYGFKAKHVAAAIAALSPLMQWDRNLALARELCKQVAATGDIEYLACIKSNARRARKALDNGIVALNGALKTTEFAHGICLVPDAAVVDRHIMVGSGNGDKKFPTAKQYHIIAEALRKAAGSVNEQVIDFQATVWLMVREPQRSLQL